MIFCECAIQNQFLIFLALLVTGGNGDFTYNFPELLSTNGSFICELAVMSYSKRMYHSQDGQTVCGGFRRGGFSRNCIKFQSGSWTNLTENLLFERHFHSSWETPNGDVLLIGGIGSPNTTEIVSLENGTSKRSFDLKYNIQ